MVFVPANNVSRASVGEKTVNYIVEKEDDDIKENSIRLFKET